MNMNKFSLHNNKRLLIGIAVVLGVILLGIGIYFLFGKLFSQGPQTSYDPIPISQIKGNYSYTFPTVESQIVLDQVSPEAKLIYLNSKADPVLSPSFNLANQFAQALNADNKKISLTSASYYSDSSSVFYSVPNNSIDISIYDSSEKRFILDEDSAIQKNKDALTQLGIKDPPVGEFAYSVKYMSNASSEPFEVEKNNADMIQVSTYLTVNNISVKKEFDNGVITTFVDEFGNVSKIFYSYLGMILSEQQYPLKSPAEAYNEMLSGFGTVFVQTKPYTEPQQINKVTITNYVIYYYYIGKEGNLIPYYSFQGTDENGDEVEILVPAIQSQYLVYSNL